jgi:truncated hemoglobin YjbI
MSTQQEPQPTLYERLGGIYNIAVVVDDFTGRVMGDARLNANPAVNEAHHKVPAAGFKYLVIEMVGSATGGPQKYTGRSMRDSHTHLNITPSAKDTLAYGWASRSRTSGFSPAWTSCGRSRPWSGSSRPSRCSRTSCQKLESHINGYSWIIVGGESGNGSNKFRPMPHEWGRNIRDLCQRRGIAFSSSRAQPLGPRWAPWTRGSTRASTYRLK